MKESREIWKPHVSVAAIIERDGRFLLVEEETGDGLRLNQPAGHLECDESLFEACRREALEETAWQFFPEELVGIYLWPVGQTGLTYLRFAFCGKLGTHEADRVLDQGILRAVWMTAEEVRATASRHRSPLIVQCMEDYLAGKRYPLDILTGYGRCA